MRLLLVQDEGKVSRFIRRGLEAERYAVDIAADGRCTVELAAAYQYDLMILDLMLPEMNGTEVLAPDGVALLEVADNACGIPAEALPHLFERFYRLDKARSRQMGGMGLGLAIIKSIVTAHSGLINVESTEGKGSRFALNCRSTIRKRNCDEKPTTPSGSARRCLCDCHAHVGTGEGDAAPGADHRDAERRGAH